MSTKLYDGLRITDHAPDIYTLTREISQRMHQVFQELAAEVIAGWLIRVVDFPQERGDDPSLTLLMRAEQLWLEQQRTMNPRRRGQDPLRFQIVFGEVSDDLGVRRLAYPFYDQSAYRNALLEMTNEVDKPYFVDYHYQNSADRPDEISEEAWNQRRKDWDVVCATDDPETNGTFAALPGWSLPDTIGEVFGTWLWMRDDLDFNQHVSQKRRLRHLVERAVWQRQETHRSTDLGEALRHNQLVRRAVTEVLSQKENADTALPMLLPSDQLITIGELPTFEPDPQLVEDVLVRFTELIASEDSQS